MSAPFNFPKEYGRMGNWPGSINANQAQALFMQALNQKPNARFVELGFDGGRTTIVLNWAASQLDAAIDSVSVADPESIIWFNRALTLHRMNREKVKAHVELKPFACDMLVINPGVSIDLPAIDDWYALMPPGGTVVVFNNDNFARGEKILNALGIAVYIKPTVKVMDRIIGNVVNEFSKEKSMAMDNVTALHGGSGSRKRLRKGDGTDSEVHAPVVANEGS